MLAMHRSQAISALWVLHVLWIGLSVSLLANVSPTSGQLFINGAYGSCSCSSLTTTLSCTSKGITTDQLISALTSGKSLGFYCPKLTDVYLDSNALTTIPDKMFSNMTSLTTVYLSNNAVTKFPSGAFSNLTVFRSLFMFTNNLTSIPADAFTLTPVLKNLYLSVNAITSVSAALLSSLPALSVLHLNSNALTTIPADLFSNLPALSYLGLKNNLITSIASGSFSNLPSLSILSLDGNILTQFSSGLFSNLPALSQLDINYNLVTSIASGVFTSLPSLYTLSLNGNSITNIAAGAFSGLPLLAGLYLSYNSISSIGAGAFSNLPKLSVLYLDHNSLSSIPGGLFVSLPKCGTLDFSYNAITSVASSAFLNLPFLSSLYLNDNAFTSIEFGPYSDLTTLVELRLQRNLITNIAVNAFVNTTKLTRCYLAYNKIGNIPDKAFSKTSVDTLDLHFNAITSIGSLTFFNSSRLRYLYLDNNNVTAIAAGTFSNAPLLYELNLGRNHLTSLPEALPSSLRLLHAHNNQIKLVPEAIKGILDNLTLLITENNPSVCKRVVDPSSLLTRAICDCAEGYYGANFCESIDQNFVVLPPISSSFSGFYLASSLVLNSPLSISFVSHSQTVETTAISIPLVNSKTVNLSIPEVYTSFATENQESGSQLLTNPITINLSLSINEPIVLKQYSTEGNFYIPYNISYSMSNTTQAQLSALGISLTSNSDLNYFFLSGTPKSSTSTFQFNIMAIEQFSTETKVSATVTLDIKDCGNYTCMNGGLCVDDSSPYNNNYTCLCAAKYRGKQCETFDDAPPSIEKCISSRVSILDSGTATLIFATAASFGNATVSDNSGSFSVSYSYVSLYGSSSSSSSSLNVSSYPLLIGEGEYEFTMKATDAAQNSQSCKFYVTIIQASFSVSSFVLYQGSSITGLSIADLSNKTVIYTVTDVRATLPKGTYVDPRSGELVGTPLEAPAPQNVTIRICDPRDPLVVCGEIGFDVAVVRYQASASVTVLPGGALGSTYSFGLDVSIIGGANCTTYQVSSGSLPPGLTMEPTTGAITGTPLAAAKSQNFTISATDVSSGLTAYVSENATFSLSVADCDNSTCVNGVCIDLAPFDGQFNCSCSPLFSVSQATGKCTVPADTSPPEIVSCLPSRVLLIGSTSSSIQVEESDLGAYNITDNSGVFDVRYSYVTGNNSSSTTVASFPVSLSRGAYLFKLTATDKSSNSRSCTFYVSALKANVSSATVIQRSQGTPSTPLTLVDLSQSSVQYSIADVSGSLPSGLYVDSKTGLLAGTPSISSPQVDSSILICDPRDPLGVCAELVFKIAVSVYQVNVVPQFARSSRRAVSSTVSFPAATFNEFYSTSPFNTSSAYISGGSGCVTFAVEGTLPAGLKMLSDGSIQGTPSSYASGQSSFRILASDASLVSTYVNDNQLFSIAVNDCSNSLSCGNGTCIDSTPNDGIYSCECSDGFVYDLPSQSCVLTAAASTSSGALAASTLGGAGAGAAIFLILVVLVAYLAYKRAMRGKPHDFASMLKLVQGLILEGDVPKQPRELKRDWLTMLEELGRGNFGTVKKAMFEEQSGRSAIRVPGFLVAVKVLREEDSDMKKDLLREALTMAQFTHPNVVSLIGVVTLGQPTLLVMEFLEKGNLNSYLRKNKTDQIQRIHWATEIASGLAYLVARGFVHRDVATRNVLLDVSLKPKIADFGMSRDTSEDKEYYRSGGGAVALRWSAIEVLEDRMFSQASDVWAYGVLLYELWTEGETPYQGWSNQKVWVELLAGYRLPPPEGCPAQVSLVMKACWDLVPSNRPSFASIPQLLNDHQSFIEHQLLSDLNDSFVHTYADFDTFKDEDEYLEPVKIIADSSEDKNARKSQVIPNDYVQLNLLPARPSVAQILRTQTPRTSLLETSLDLVTPRKSK